MENLINETNGRLQDIIANLGEILDEYKKKLENNAKDIEEQLTTVQNYRLEFYASKEKIEKMNADIEGFEADYQKLVERFKDDELANILVAANKEISAKIDERKKQIAKDRLAMNDIVKKAEDVKKKLVKLNAEKKALEVCLEKILDSHEFYSRALNQVIEYTENNQDNLCACFYDETISDMIANEEHSDNYSVDELNITKDEYIIEEKDEVILDEELEVVTDEVEYDDEDETEEVIEEDTDEEIEDEEIEEEEISEVDEDEIQEAEIDSIDEEEYEIGETPAPLEEVVSEDEDENDENINIDDIYIEIASVSDEDEDDEDFDDEEIVLENEESIYIDEEDEDFEVQEEDFDDNDEIDLNNIAEILLEEIENTPVGEDEDGSILDDHSIEGNEHELEMDEFPSEELDFNDELDLENLINFNDELEDEEK